jgi:hypothetical protein
MAPIPQPLPAAPHPYFSAAVPHALPQHRTPPRPKPSMRSQVATLFDDDGILVRFMNSPAEGNGVRSAADAAALLGQVHGRAGGRGRWGGQGRTALLGVTRAKASGEGRGIGARLGSRAWR